MLFLLLIFGVIMIILKCIFYNETEPLPGSRIRTRQFLMSEPLYSYESNVRVTNFRNALILPTIHHNRVSISRPCSEIAGELPEEFTHELPLETAEAFSVKFEFSKFSRSNYNRLVVKKIYKVNNPYILKMYKLRKEEMTSRDGRFEEKLLFHGTKRKYVHSICNNNFDWRRSGSSVGHKFGQGVSFTPKATYAHHYCDRHMQLKAMFLANVLHKRAIIGTSGMVIPAVRQNGQTIIYDASMNEDGSVIVKYCDNEFYPTYIIYFTIMK